MISFKNYRYSNQFSKPHVVADSAFGSLQMLKDITAAGWTGTLSMPCNEPSYLWNVLNMNVPPNHWRAAYLSQSGL